ncbi:MAG: apolipoprotein N-acyltransferase [Rhodospirillaceae bacterium]|jgi:apolipoprotein N-acyltransferase|nr:apolipoprotein N-acyltransferase [Rhodospirillaceae bacterium]MBT5358207.1 apolipoprotein N-acyltransferase [Rhodospirillaceae bacterium]MBT5943991.1 apolipoprotein N-acyltransferase [Rhodospirillaceae bacterium]MBT6404096.1 apolipoprotein N-acyltransferase [Rhodospirillaceae bacterium]MBT7361076.1 apolipoprotein N-acyltransferase [Rhodospirillaceae bacterium]
MLTIFAERLGALSGWRRAATSLLLGAISALALPPFHIVPLLVPAFVGLLWILDGADAAPRRRRLGLWIGFWFGFGHFIVGLHWIAEPLLVDPARTAWLIPIALPGLAAGLAVFPALACGALLALPFRGAPAARVVGLAALWMVAEFARGIVFTGFPWNLMGYVWAGAPSMMQVTAVVGVLGLSGLTILAAGMPSILAADGKTAARRWGLAVAVTIMLPLGLWAGGQARLAGANDAGEALIPDVHLRIVQANIAQRDKWDQNLRAAHLERHLALSRTPAAVAPTHVIWPETAVPFLLANDVLARVRSAAAAPPGGALITGSVRRAFHNETQQLRNALLVIDAAADVQRVYDKSHLVPFGEYVPLRGVLPIDKIVPGQSDFVAGVGRRLLEIPGLPAVSPLICYEAIFSGRVTPHGARPGLLLNLTNDAWFGTFAGPQQHFAIASTRAVEEGLPLVRAANTGISAVVDPYGRVIARLDIGEQGVLDSGLPAALSPTPFARWGELIPMIMAALFLGFALVLARRRKSP